jgi:hypothetical protein
MSGVAPVLSRLMRRLVHIKLSGTAYCLVELLVVLVLLSACVAGGAAFSSRGLARQEARGSAQSWQAAAAWAQLGVLWHGGETQVHVTPDRLRLDHDIGSCGDDLGASAPHSPVSTNVGRWQTADGINVIFGGPLASPDSGGSLYWEGDGGTCRVTIRPESGLTTRTWTEQ